jgi:hypothetical protein
MLAGKCALITGPTAGRRRPDRDPTRHAKIAALAGER